MKDTIFRLLALLLGCAIFYVHLFTDSLEGQSDFASIRNIAVGIVFLVYAAGGKKLMQKIPVLKHFSSAKDET